METPSPTHGTAVKLLAIIGFFSILALVVWLLIQGVRLFPNAVSSLASIAETVGEYRPDEELILTIDRTMVNSGDMVTLSWTDMGKGSYTFTHTCEDETTLSVRTDADSLRELSCNDTLTLPTGALGLYLAPFTKTERFSDVTFTVTFIPENKTLRDTHVGKETLTVINASIPLATRVSTDTATPETPETPAPRVISLPEEKEDIPKPLVPKTQEVTAPSKPKTTEKPASTLPASSIVALMPKSFDNGFTDLRIAYQGVGIMKNGTFVPSATWSDTDTLALRFEVKNIGTKTSEGWSYALSLPGDLSYTSDSQTPLSPNERAVFTAQFEMEDVRGNSTTVEGVVNVRGDTNATNNSFSWSVDIN